MEAILSLCGGYFRASRGQIVASGGRLEASWGQHEASKGQHGASEGQLYAFHGQSSCFTQKWKWNALSPYTKYKHKDTLSLNGHNLVIFQSILKNYRCFGISKTSSFQWASSRCAGFTRLGVINERLAPKQICEKRENCQNSSKYQHVFKGKPDWPTGHFHGIWSFDYVPKIVFLDPHSG